MLAIPFRKSLAFRLLLISFILLALPLLVDSFIIIQRTYKDATQDAKEFLVDVTTSRALPLSELQPAQRPTLVILETYLNLKENFPAKPMQEMDEKLQKLALAGEFYEIFLIKKTDDSKYIVTGSNRPEMEGQDYTDFIKLLDIYSSDARQLGYFSYLYYDALTEHPFFLVGRVIYSSETEEELGILLITTDVSQQLKKLLEPINTPYEVDFALLIPNEIVFAASDPDFEFQHFAPMDSEQKTQLETRILGGKKIAKDALKKTSLADPLFQFVWKGKEHIGFSKRLATSNISIMAYATKKSIYAKPFIKFLDVFAVYIFILIIGGGLAYLLTKRLAKPLLRLGGTMREIQKGNHEFRYENDPFGYEINTVGQIFNEMIGTLFQKQLLAQQERVEKETYAQELLIGQQVQRKLLLEKVPEYPGVDLAERYIPAKEVGGDFFDIYVKNNETHSILALTIADASGKGVRACLYSLGVRSMLRTYAQEFDDVAKVMEKTNQLFCKDTGDSGMFITVYMAFFNKETKILEYYSCGHNPSYLRKKNGEILVLDHLGMAMGLTEFKNARSQSVQLESGDLVLFYTDGITEAHDKEFRMYSEERLMKFLNEKGDQSAEVVAKSLLDDLQSFVGDAPQHDDITLLIMRVL